MYQSRMPFLHRKSICARNPKIMTKLLSQTISKQNNRSYSRQRTHRSQIKSIVSEFWNYVTSSRLRNSLETNLACLKLKVLFKRKTKQEKDTKSMQNNCNKIHEFNYTVLKKTVVKETALVLIE